MNYQDNRYAVYIAIYFFFFGVVCTCIYTAFTVIIMSLKKSFLAHEVIRDYVAKKNLSLLKQNTKKRLICGADETFCGEAFNCLFIIAVGVFLTLLNYILLDGELRIYAIVAFLGGFFISAKLLSKYIRSVISRIIEIIYISFFVLSRPAFSLINNFKSKRKKKD